MAEEIYLEMYIYGQLSEVQMVRDLDLGSGQGHVNIHSTRRAYLRAQPRDCSITQYQNMAI